MSIEGPQDGKQCRIMLEFREFLAQPALVWQIKKLRPREVNRLVQGQAVDKM